MLNILFGLCLPTLSQSEVEFTSYFNYDFILDT